MKEDEPQWMLKSRYAAGRLHDLNIGMDEKWKELIRNRGWGNLLNVGSFSAPESLLEWIIDRIDPVLGEFRNPNNNTSILFNKDMVDKALGHPPGTKPVVITSKHQESAHREFYKIEYDHGRRAPIHYATGLLENEKEQSLYEETFFRTFFLVALATHLAPGTGNMLPLEYLGSLEVSSEVCEYTWGELILQNVMYHIAEFQKKKKKAILDGTFKKIRVGGCLPMVVFRPFHMTPYAIQPAILQDQPHEPHVIPEHPPTSTNQLPEELPEFLIPIFQKHKILWAQDIARATSQLNRKHAKRMSDFAQDVIAATKEQTTDIAAFSSPPPPPPRAVDASNIEKAQGSGSKATPNTRFWQEATAYADEVEQSRGKATHNNHVTSSTSMPCLNQDTADQERRRRLIDAMEVPSCSLLQPDETWTQIARQPPPTPEAQDTDVATPQAQTTTPGPSSISILETNLARQSHEPSPVPQSSPITATNISKDIGFQELNTNHFIFEDPAASIVHDTIGTQTQDNRNRKMHGHLQPSCASHSYAPYF